MDERRGGSATDLCLRLFGDRAEVGGVQVCRPFHSVSEAEVARAGMIFELGHIQRKCLVALSLLDLVLLGYLPRAKV